MESTSKQFAKSAARRSRRLDSLIPDADPDYILYDSVVQSQNRHRHSWIPGCYSRRFDLPLVSESYIETQRQRYRKADLLDMTPLHVHRAGVTLFHQETGRHEREELPCVRVQTQATARTIHFQEEIKTATTRIHQMLNRLLASSGIEIYLFRRLKDVDPILAETYDEEYGTPLKNTPAFYSDGRVYIAEQYVLNGLPQDNYVHNMGARHATFHELGHAINHILPSGYLSDCPLFTRAYDRDVKRINTLPDRPDAVKIIARNRTSADTGDIIRYATAAGITGTASGTRHNLSYFLMKRDGGIRKSFAAACDEAFAEIFATQMTGVEYHAGFRETFREATRAAEKIVKSVIYDMHFRPTPQQLLAGAPVASLRIGSEAAAERVPALR